MSKVEEPSIEQLDEGAGVNSGGVVESSPADVPPAFISEMLADARLEHGSPLLLERRACAEAPTLSDIVKEIEELSHSNLVEEIESSYKSTTD